MVKESIKKDTIEDCGMGEYYGDYWKNEMEQEDKMKNEMKTLDEIVEEFVSGLVTWKKTLKNFTKLMNYYIYKRARKKYGFYLIREDKKDVIFMKGDKDV